MIIVLSLLLTEKAFAGHRSHSSHRTHSSHRSHVSHSSGGHTSHYTHSSHTSSHGSHSTHSPHSTHSTTHSTHNTHSTHSSHSDHYSHVSHNSNIHSNAAPSYSDLKITPPSMTDTVAPTEAPELGISMGTIMPSNAVDSVDVDSINMSIEAEVKVPPSTPNAN